MSRSKTVCGVAAAALAAAATATAQPYPVPTLPADGSGSANGSASVGSNATTAVPPLPVPPPTAGSDTSAPTGEPTTAGGAGTAGSDGSDDSNAPTDSPHHHHHPPNSDGTDTEADEAAAQTMSLPQLIETPTAFILPAGVIYARTSIDTGGGAGASARVGLGDVAEFGVSTTDDVRAKTASGATPDQIQPYTLATFRMGVAEHRLFGAQPALAIGFDKSFAVDHDGYTTRVAELSLVASKHLGTKTAIHIGGAFWDASLAADDNSFTETLHDDGLRTQVRGFGGIEVQANAQSQILVDFGYGPEFCYACNAGDRIRLSPILSWGVRYQVASWLRLESGVRVADIGDANLLDAQIYGALSITSWALHRIATTH